MTQARPEKVTGGCLCGEIKYEVSFSEESQWPPMVATCQCSMCRKWTGCLVSHDLIVSKTQVSPAWESFTTFRTHESSPGTKRAFCSKCGSGLAWFSEYMKEEVVIFVGTIDEEYLLGRIIEDSVKETEHGSELKRTSAYAKELCEPSAGNLYWQNALPGITNHLNGPKFLQHFMGKAPLPEST